MQHALKAKTKFGCEDFSRVGWANRCEIISKHHSSFEQIYHAIIFKARRIKQRWGQTRFLELLARKEPLIPDIVQGEYGTRSRYLRPISINGIEIDRAQRCLPIMQMKDMGIPSARGLEIANHLYRRAAEE